MKNAANDLEAMQDKLDRLDDELDELDEDRDRIRRRILDAVLTKWPELASPYHAEARRLLSGNAREVVELVRSKKELGELEERELSIREKEREKLDVEKKKARLERWLNAVEALAAEDALRKSGNKKWIEALDRIQACESLEP